MLPLIIGLAGPALAARERAFIRAAGPAGVILFGRNVVDPAQLRALTDALREAAGRADLPILIDQEGGRVARLGPPHWPAFPAAARFGGLYEVAPISAIEAARANGEAVAATLVEAGINVNCAPVLDLACSGAHEVIGDRAFAAAPMWVAALGRAMLDGLAAGGVAGIVKHIPGHGRARADSHAELPVIDAGAAELEDDLAPFRALARASFAMVAHMLYSAWDAARPASLSPIVIGDVIRGRIGFAGLLISDDIAMAALDGAMAERAAAAHAAGCDLVLHCTGDLAEAEAIAAALPAMPAETADRLAAAIAEVAANRSAAGADALIAKRDALLAYGP
jgi:beta-N-acetylhexosaminidase